MRKSRLRAPLAVAAAVLAPALTMGLSLASFSLLVVPWTEAFDVSRATIMGALAIATMGMTLASPLVGWLIVKLTPRVVFCLGVALLAAGLLLAGSATSFPIIALAYIVPIALGIVFAGSLPAMTVAIGHYPERAGALSGLIGLGAALLGALAPILAANLIVLFGWRTMLQISAVAVFVIVLPLAWFLLIGRAAPAADEPGTPRAADGWTAAATLRRPAFWLIIVGVLPIMLALTAIQSNIAVIADDAGLSPQTAGYLVSIVAAGAALGAVVVGWLADRLDPRIIYTLAAGLIGAALFLMMGPGSFGRYALALAALGVAAGGAGPIISVLVIRHFSVETFPRVLGLLSPFLLPASLGAVFAGLVRDRTGGYDLVFVTVAAALLPGLLAMWRLAPQRRPPGPAFAAPLPAAPTVCPAESG